jgi:hypothetical protein
MLRISENMKKSLTILFALLLRQITMTSAGERIAAGNHN